MLYGERGFAELASLAADNASEMVRLRALNALTFVAGPSAAMPIVSRLVYDRGYLGRAPTYLARVQDRTYDPSVPPP